MSRGKVSCVKNGKARVAMWESGVCPYCGSKEITKTSVTKRVRGCDHELTGVEYGCGGCGSKNVFTKR